jgi:transposase
LKKAYSKDVREIAIKKYTLGMDVNKISKDIHVSPRTIYYWIEDFKLRNKIEPISYSLRALGKPSKLRQIKDDKKFEDFVQNNYFLTKQQMADLWNEETKDNVTVTGISTALKRTGFTLKKASKTYIQRDENKRKQFNEKLDDLKKNHNRNNVFF